MGCICIFTYGCPLTGTFLSILPTADGPTFPLLTCPTCFNTDVFACTCSGICVDCCTIGLLILLIIGVAKFGCDLLPITTLPSTLPLYTGGGAITFMTGVDVLFTIGEL